MLFQIPLPINFEVTTESIPRYSEPSFNSRIYHAQYNKQIQAHYSLLEKTINTHHNSIIDKQLPRKHIIKSKCQHKQKPIA